MVIIIRIYNEGDLWSGDMPNTKKVANLLTEKRD